MRVPSVLVVVPTLGGKIACELGMRLLHWEREPGVHVEYHPVAFKAPLDSARNEAVRDFMRTNLEWLFFCDDDVVPPPFALRRLLAAKKSIVAAICLTFKEDDDMIPFTLPCAFRLDPDGYRAQYGRGLEEVDVIGGGAFLVHREVFAALDSPPFAFTYHEDGTVEHSEDFVFSQRAKAAGFKLWCDFGCLCKHYREVDTTGINALLKKITQEKAET